MARAGFVEAVADGELVLPKDGWGLGDDLHGTAAGVSGQGIDVDPLLRDQLVVVEDLEGEAATLIQEAGDSLGVDLHGDLVEAVQFGKSDIVFGH